MPRRIIYLKNPSQGSHFRTLGGGGKGGGKTGGAKGSANLSPSLMIAIFEWMKTGHVPKWPDKVGKGKGTPYTPGIFIGTGGARYKTPGSNWFKGKKKQGYKPYELSDMLFHQGAGPYELVFSPFPFNIGGIDHNAMNIQPPWGTPGTLVPLAGSDLIVPMEAFKRPGADYEFFGGTGPQSIPSGYSGIDPNWDKPDSAFVAAWKKGQKQELRIDFSNAGVLPRSWKFYPSNFSTPATQRIAWSYLLGPLHTKKQEEFWSDFFSSDQQWFFP